MEGRGGKLETRKQNRNACADRAGFAGGGARGAGATGGRAIGQSCEGARGRCSSRPELLRIVRLTLRGAWHTQSLAGLDNSPIHVNTRDNSCQREIGWVSAGARRWLGRAIRGRYAAVVGIRRAIQVRLKESGLRSYRDFGLGVRPSSTISYDLSFVPGIISS